MWSELTFRIRGRHPTYEEQNNHEETRHGCKLWGYIKVHNPLQLVQCMTPCCLAAEHAGKRSSLYCWRYARSSLSSIVAEIYRKTTRTIYLIFRNDPLRQSANLHVWLILSFIQNFLTGSVAMATCCLDVHLSFKDRDALTWTTDSGSCPRLCVRLCCLIKGPTQGEKADMAVDCGQAAVFRVCLVKSAAPFLQCANARTFTVIVLKPLCRAAGCDCQTAVSQSDPWNIPLLLHFYFYLTKCFYCVLFK